MLNLDRLTRTPTPRNHSRHAPRRTAWFTIGLLCFCFAPSVAQAALQTHTLRWIPSVSSDVTGYVLSVGSASSAYDATFDLGLPSVNNGEMRFQIEFDDASDLYIALRARSSANLFSAFSNEVVLPAAAGPPPPPTAGFDVLSVTGTSSVVSGTITVVANAEANTGSVLFLLDGQHYSIDDAAPFSFAGDTSGALNGWDSSTVADGSHTITAIGYPQDGATGSAGGGISVNFVVSNGAISLPNRSVGVIASAPAQQGGEGRIDLVSESGVVTPLLTDPAALPGGVRPAWCDLDGDGNQDLVIGFGSAGAGRTLLVRLGASGVVGVDEIDLGDTEIRTGFKRTTTYREYAGETRPACGDLDGDGRNELVIGLGKGVTGKVRVFDDITTGYAEFWQTDGTATTDISFGGFLEKDRGAWPAIGDIDGDGLDEIVVCRSGPGTPGLAAFDDALTDFAPIFSDIGLDPSSTRFPIPPDIAFAHDGSLRPALGDLDGDGRAELVLGLGVGGGQRVYLLEDGNEAFERITASTATSDGSLSVGWAANQAGGETIPSIGDIDGDGQLEIVIGFGPGVGSQLWLLDDIRSRWDVYPTAAGFVGFVQLPGQHPIAPAASP